MAANQKSYRAEEVIFTEGDTPYAIYIIKRGQVSIRKKKGSSYVEVGRLYQNEVLGEMAFFDRKNRSATAVAASEVELLEIRFDGLEKVYSTLPDYLRSIIAAIVERLRKANETVRKLQDAQQVDKKRKSVDTEELLEDAAALLEATATPTGQGSEGGGGQAPS